MRQEHTVRCQHLNIMTQKHTALGAGIPMIRRTEQIGLGVRTDMSWGTENTGLGCPY